MPYTQNFANGFKFGELLHKCGFQEDFQNFNNSHTPQAMINNYGRLQVIYCFMITLEFIHAS